ncbi:MAG: hypothetical protein HOL65_04765 [Microbacteriaceae bacterium]|jgi:hypothetical protein|nr:hypothetical protein [Microbacteriaceae bacterium]MBT5248083.1 hypothetical protein [Microbacteriaceae bacterium]MBT5730524.1 hypothetical protein [Microbacteriaceae bacterium]MBT7803220.1 hypothetical protein [Microbacteriaceae bacterium]
MPRSNRPKNNRSRGRGREEPEALDMDRLTTGFRRTESKRGYAYTVQPISEKNAQKTYTCPGCHLSVDVGVAHLVAWRNDGIMGEERDVSERRHWHKHCWRIY